MTMLGDLSIGNLLSGNLWSWGSPIWFVAIAVGICYVLAFRNVGLKRFWVQRFSVLAIGMVLAVLAFVSPIGTLSEGYLFSAHMIQHLLLLLVVPLCLLLALPPAKADRSNVGQVAEASLSNERTVSRILRWNGVPVLGWVLGVGAMWFWHVPSLCSAATQSAPIGLIRDASFIFAGLVFWWPIYSPLKACRLKPLDGICYLFSACLGCTLLGIYITFTTVSVCPAFANPSDRIAIMNSLYDAGLTPSVDQSLGGLLMWVPPCTLYVGAIISLLCRWYMDIEPIAETRPSTAKTPQQGYAS